MAAQHWSGSGELPVEDPNAPDDPCAPEVLLKGHLVGWDEPGYIGGPPELCYPPDQEEEWTELEVLWIHAHCRWPRWEDVRHNHELWPAWKPGWPDAAAVDRRVEVRDEQHLAELLGVEEAARALQEIAADIRDAAEEWDDERRMSGDWDE